jgi:tRNA(Ile)-lysidine synthase
VSAADGATPVSAVEARDFFNFLSRCPAAILAISGGPDSTALMVLAARWRRTLKRGPKLTAITIDHGLRPEAAREAAAVHRLARKLGIAHRTLRWTGRKPKTGLQQAAREARYRLLAQAARKENAKHVVTGHTRDDQAETVLMRLLRGSGLQGLVGMGPQVQLPYADGDAIWLVRPFLSVPKARLIATLSAAKIPYAQDRSNTDPRFTRARLRGVMSALANEGLTVDRLVRFADRVQRSELTIVQSLIEAEAELAPRPWPPGGPICFDAHAYCDLPEELALRLLGLAIDWVGDEGPVELGKLEAMAEALFGPLIAYTHDTGCPVSFRRTLAGAVVTLKSGKIVVERAPRRRGATKRP